MMAPVFIRVQRSSMGSSSVSQRTSSLSTPVWSLVVSKTSQTGHSSRKWKQPPWSDQTLWCMLVTTSTGKVLAPETSHAQPSTTAAFLVYLEHGVTIGRVLQIFSLLPSAFCPKLLGLSCGNQRCRGGAGFLFLDSRAVISAPTLRRDVVPFANEQFLIITAMVEDVDVDDVCPKQSDQKNIFPSNRLEDPKQHMNETQILEQVDLYGQQFGKLENMKLPNVTNFLLSHHPIFGIRCNKGRYESCEWTLQQALTTSTLNGISATIHGHVHWFQGLEFSGLPNHLVVGNGGTLLRNYTGPEHGASGMELVLSGRSVPVTRAFTKGVFGYSSLALDGSYSFTAYERGQKESMWDTVLSSGRFLKESILV
ncbi:unnamed protein product [Effrenium voratum]|nr:unnamed protein product [Effrenium voratum]